MQETVTPSAKRDDPINGHLFSPQRGVVLQLQTIQAQLLVRGRNAEGKAPIAGLLRFAEHLRIIWSAAQANDPYADWWLIKVEDALATTIRRTEVELTQLGDLLETSTVLRIAPTEYKDPFQIELLFATPYAFKAADGLMRFDRLVVEGLTARNVGLITQKQFMDTTRGIARKFRALFAMPMNFRLLDVSRDRPLSVSGLFSRAETLMGPLPEDVLNGKRRARLAPDIESNRMRDVPPVLVDALEPKGSNQQLDGRK